MTVQRARPIEREDVSSHQAVDLDVNGKGRADVFPTGLKTRLHAIVYNHIWVVVLKPHPRLFELSGRGGERDEVPAEQLTV